VEPAADHGLQIADDRAVRAGELIGHGGASLLSFNSSLLVIVRTYEFIQKQTWTADRIFHIGIVCILQHCNLILK